MNKGAFKNEFLPEHLYRQHYKLQQHDDGDPQHEGEGPAEVGHQRGGLQRHPQ